MAQDLEVIVSRLRDTFGAGITRPLAWRRAQLRGLQRMIHEQQRVLIDALVRDLHRSRLEASLLDLMPVKGELRDALKHLSRWTKPQRVGTPLIVRPARSWIVSEPLGTVLVIAPWNYPLQLALAPMVAALAAGNCVVLKPSELAPACAAVLADLLPRYLDPSAVAVVTGGADETQALLQLGFDHCFFTGSPAVGRAVMRTAAEHLTPVTLELGGKCPAVVTKSARIDVAAKRIAWGKVANSGQTCVAPDYVLVDRRVHDEFVQSLVKALHRFAKKPLPIVSESHAQRLADLIADAGGRIRLGGNVDVAKRSAEVTVISDPAPASRALEEELFGPLLPVVAVDDLDAAVAHIRAGTKPLAAYLFTERSSDERRFNEAVSSGALVINHVMVHLSNPNLPFGGVGTSGTGKYHGRWGFDTFSNTKAVMRNRTSPDLTLVYPPYRGLRKWVLGRL